MYMQCLSQRPDKGVGFGFLMIQKVLSHTWVLGIELPFSGRAVSALNNRTISIALNILIFDGGVRNYVINSKSFNFY